MKGHVLAATEYIYGDEDEIIKVEDWIGQIDGGLKVSIIKTYNVDIKCSPHNPFLE